MMASETVETIEKVQLKIGGMQCSFCTKTINQALSHIKGVKKVDISLAHEEALIQFNPNLVSPIRLKDTLRSLGFKIRDPNKIRSFEEENEELRHERNRLFVAAIALLFLPCLYLVGILKKWLMRLYVGGYLINMYY
jgi:copper chaperone CopZ